MSNNIVSFAAKWIVAPVIVMNLVVSCGQGLWSGVSEETSPEEGKTDQIIASTTHHFIHNAAVAGKAICSGVGLCDSETGGLADPEGVGSKLLGTGKATAEWGAAVGNQMIKEASKDHSDVPSLSEHDLKECKDMGYQKALMVDDCEPYLSDIN